MKPFGYARMYTILVMLTVIVGTVLLYQSIAYREETVETEVLVRNATRVQLFSNNLSVLSQGAYELWVKTETGDISLGKFQVTDEKAVVTTQGELDGGVFTLPANLSPITGAAISVSSSLDPRGDDSVIYLTGDIENDRVSLAFPVDFSEAEAEFMMATPTDNDSLVNEKSGVWFGDVLKNQPALTLPELPENWVYEGWINIDGKTLTTGSFVNPQEKDLFAGFSDTKGQVPNFPGEDFLKDPPVAVFPDLVFPLDVTGNLVQLSIEPRFESKDPTGAGQFPHILLEKSVSRRSQPYEFINLELAEMMPSALVVFR